MSSIFLIIGLCIVLGLGAYLLFFQKREPEVDEWKIFADRHKFHFDAKNKESEYPVVYGMKDGRRFFMGYFSQEVSSEVKSTYTLMKFELKGSFPYGLQIHENFFSSSFTQNLIDRTVVQTLDANFDNKACVKAKNEEDALKYLTHERKEAILKLIALGGRVKDNNLFYQIETRLAGLENMNNKFNAFLELAKMLDNM